MTAPLHDTDACTCNDDVLGLGACSDCRAEFARQRETPNYRARWRRECGAESHPETPLLARTDSEAA